MKAIFSSPAARLQCLALLCLAIAPGALQAASVIYANNPGALNFTDGANWVGGVAPGTADIAFVNGVDGITNYAYVDSSVTVQRFLIGELSASTGGLEIRNGGVLTSSLTSTPYVGARGVGYLRILEGGTFNANGALQVGWGDGTGRGTGTVTQSGGAYNGNSTSAGITIGNSAASGSFGTSVGAYNLNGGTMTLGGPLIVGNAGNGTFNMNSGPVLINSYLQIGRTGTGTFIQTTGELGVYRASVDPGMVIAPFASNAGATAVYQISGGSLTIANTNSGLTNGLAAGTGAGTFKVIGNAATISIGSNYTQFDGAALALDIGAGISPLNVAANATLAGILDVKFTTTPTLGQQFTILNYGGALAGTFSTFDDLVDSPAGANTVKLSIDYGAGSAGAVVLKVDALITAHPGDFDGDGDVDGADFVAWQTNFPTASGAGLAQGDADGDGDVDGADFVVWQTNFPFTPGPGTSPVPEPTALMLLAMGGIGLLIRGRRAR